MSGIGPWTVVVTLAAALAAPVAVGCASKGPRSPHKLRDAYADALRRADPARAYALLSPELRAQITYEEFARRWKDQAAEREATAHANATLPEHQVAAVYGGITAHADGHVLRWTQADGRYYVANGLPGTRPTSTPAQTIRSLIAAVRTTDLTQVRALLGDELADAIDRDWDARVEAMEAALDRPGSIELSSDLRRAELRYEQGRVLTLEQTPSGWRITSLE